MRATTTFETNFACEILEGDGIQNHGLDLTCLRTTATSLTALLFLKAEAVGELVARAWMVTG